MPRKLYAVILVGLLGLPAIASDGLMTGEIVAQYPSAYTKLLAMDLAKMSDNDVLRENVLAPLAAANHPLNGIRRSLALLDLDEADVEYAAYAIGSGVTPFSLVRGVDTTAAMRAAEDLGAPGSAYTNWALETLDGTPTIFTGGMFGPFQMQWAYLGKNDNLWIGSEIGLIGPPDQQRLRASTELILDRTAGEGPVFSELCVALGVRGGDMAFVRISDPSVDRPFEPGEEAMGYSIRFHDAAADEAAASETRATVNFIVRFASVEQAVAASEKITADAGGYLALDLYHAELVKLTPAGDTLLFEVRTDLPGIIGLLMLTMPM